MDQYLHKSRQQKATMMKAKQHPIAYAITAYMGISVSEVREDLLVRSLVMKMDYMKVCRSVNECIMMMVTLFCLALCQLSPRTGVVMQYNEVIESSSLLFVVPSCIFPPELG